MGDRKKLIVAIGAFVGVLLVIAAIYWFMNRPVEVPASTMLQPTKEEKPFRVYNIEALQRKLNLSSNDVIVIQSYLKRFIEEKKPDQKYVTINYETAQTTLQTNYPQRTFTITLPDTSTYYVEVVRGRVIIKTSAQGSVIYQSSIQD